MVKGRRNYRISRNTFLATPKETRRERQKNHSRIQTELFREMILELVRQNIADVTQVTRSLEKAMAKPSAAFGEYRLEHAMWKKVIRTPQSFRRWLRSACISYIQKISRELKSKVLITTEDKINTFARLSKRPKIEVINSYINEQRRKLDELHSANIIALKMNVGKRALKILEVKTSQEEQRLNRLFEMLRE